MRWRKETLPVMAGVWLAFAVYADAVREAARGYAIAKVPR